MRKLFRSRKALSPVVAAIILIAVTVAVSIAVAAWMGALTFTFMATEELKITRVIFDTSDQTRINVVANNTGTAKLTIMEAQVNNAKESFAPDVGYYATIGPGEGTLLIITLTANWKNGTKYEIALITAAGNKFNYVATAPS